MMIKPSLWLAGLSMAASVSASAAIIDLGNITRDTDTGLDWLDVTVTRGMAYNQVFPQTQSGVFEGWRYATLAELDQLISNFGYVAVDSDCDGPALHCDYSITGDSPIIEAIIATLGDTLLEYFDEKQSFIDFPAAGNGSTRGLLAPLEPNGDPISANIHDGEAIYRDTGEVYGDADDIVTSGAFTVARDFAYNGRGSFLVMPSPVPLPAAGWLLISALLGLTGAKRFSQRIVTA